MNGSGPGEERDVSKSVSNSPFFKSSGNGNMAAQCGLSLVASRASKWPELAPGMIDLFHHDGDLEAIFGD